MESWGWRISSVVEQVLGSVPQMLGEGRVEILKQDEEPSIYDSSANQQQNQQ